MCVPWRYLVPYGTYTCTYTEVTAKVMALLGSKSRPSWTTLFNQVFRPPSFGTANVVTLVTQLRNTRFLPALPRRRTPMSNGGNGGSGGSGDGAPPPEWSPVPVLAVVHGWLRRAALDPAKSLLIDCLVERGELVLPQSLDSSDAGRIVQVEWAFSGKPVPGRLHLPWPRSHAAIESADDCAASVVALQMAVARMLDAHVPLSTTTLPQDVRLFAGHGGPELTWPDLAWFPDRAASPPPDTMIALQRLRMGGTVLVATRGDFGTRMLEARTTSLCECQPSRTTHPTCSLSGVAVVHCPLPGVDVHRPGGRLRMVSGMN